MSIGEGQKIGNYRILSKLGVGGMGAVYLAEHPLIGKKVALKVIHKELAGNKEVVARFFNEARAVNKIGNEHIVEIHDFGQTDAGEHFFIMEYLQGRTLAHVLDTERVMIPRRALHVAAQIADGLAAAHACGIIHRDLKPDNIMLIPHLGDNDFVKVLDFGLAKMFVDSNAKQLTAAGVVLGTPQYMSPEACESKRDIDHRSDIYSMGILLFQMLTGQVPFDGETMGEVLVKHVTQAPPAPRALNPNVPPSVEQIVLRCLAKPVDARFATMRELREALMDPDRYLASSPPVIPAAPITASAQARTMFAQPAVSPGPAAPSGPPPDGRAFALKPPPPSIAGASAKTAFMTNDIGHAPTGALPVVGAPPGNGASAAASAKTAFMDAGAVPQVTDSQVAAASHPTAVPGMEPPREAENKTMFIGTPEGYSDKPPPGSKWPIVAALLSVVVVIGGGVGAVLLLGGKDKDANAETKSAADDETKTPVVPDAAPAAKVVDKKPAPAKVPEPAKPKMAVIKLNTAPEGATVFDANGKKLGVTPTELEFPDDGKEHKVTLRHPKAKEREKVLVASGTTAVNVELQLLERPGKRRHRPRPQRPRKDSDDEPKRKPKSKPNPKSKPDDGMMKPTFD